MRCGTCEGVSNMHQFMIGKCRECGVTVTTNVLDQAVIEAADAYVGKRNRSMIELMKSEKRNLILAVRARREAMKPKPRYWVEPFTLVGRGADSFFTHRVRDGEAVVAYANLERCEQILALLNRQEEK